MYDVSYTESRTRGMVCARRNVADVSFHMSAALRSALVFFATPPIVQSARISRYYNNTIFTSLMAEKKSTPEGNANVLGGGSHRRPVAIYININIIVIMYSRAYTREV